MWVIFVPVIELEELAGEMRSAADADRGVRELVGPRFRERDELLDRARLRRRVHDEEEHVRGDLRDRLEILHRVVRHLLLEARD